MYSWSDRARALEIVMHCSEPILKELLARARGADPRAMIPE
jgi:hypothetical protein